MADASKARYPSSFRHHDQGNKKVSKDDEEMKDK
jgi:hypothetical protein